MGKETMRILDKIKKIEKEIQIAEKFVMLERMKGNNPTFSDIVIEVDRVIKQEKE